MERVMNYDEAFVQAVLRTHKYHLKTDDVFLRNFGLLHNDYFLDVQSVNNAFKRRFGTPKVKDVYGQCIAMSLKYHDVLSKCFGINSCLTIGNVYLSDGRSFGMAESDYVSFITNSVYGLRRLDLHVWLTLPSGRIFDPTIISTISYELTVSSPELWDVIIAPPDKLVRIKYTPVFIGKDYLKVTKITHPTGIELILRIIRNIKARFHD